MKVEAKEKTVIKKQLKATNRMASLKQLFTIPKYTLLSFLILFTFVGVDLLTGRNQIPIIAFVKSTLQTQLLSQNVKEHLTQSEIFLTQVSNDNNPLEAKATAEKLLIFNRILRRELTKEKDLMASQLLSDLEPILLEFANGAPSESQANPASLVKQVKSSNLMFQIKAMKLQLAGKQVMK